MRKLMFLTFVFISTFTYSQNTSKVKWYSIEEALELNKTNPKKIMIDVYTDWCVWCKRMDQSTFSNPVIAAYLNKNYYPVKFNAESSKPIVFGGKTYIKPEGTRTTHQFAVTLLNGKISYPSIAYLDKNLVLLGAIPGFQQPKKMELILNFIANDLFKTTTMEEYEKTFVSKIQ